jgi:predicted ribonuclease YlaK
LARARSSEQFDALRALVALGIAGNDGEVVLVPDTNALLFNPDVAVYGGVLGRAGYMVVMLPTVLSELDDLKDRGRTGDVREQAGKVIKRIKGLRDRGSLINGVKVAGQVHLRAEPWEPQASSVLDWLDPAVPDDRIIAAALDLQARQAAEIVVLATRDINLQNKAAAVGLPFVEPPRP